MNMGSFGAPPHQIVSLVKGIGGSKTMMIAEYLNLIINVVKAVIVALY